MKFFASTLLLGAALFISTVSCQLCLSETNNERAQNGLGPLTNNDQLVSAAKAHNDFMIATNCFEHQCTNDDEPDLGTRVSNTGYSWGGVAENIAAGSGDCAGTMNQWMNSAGHRANILGDYVDVGCAMGTCSNCDWPTYWTCVYASPL